MRFYVSGKSNFYFDLIFLIKTLNLLKDSECFLNKFDVYGELVTDSRMYRLVWSTWNNVRNIWNNTFLRMRYISLCVVGHAMSPLLFDSISASLRLCPARPGAIVISQALLQNQLKVINIGNSMLQYMPMLAVMIHTEDNYYWSSNSYCQLIRQCYFTTDLVVIQLITFSVH